MTRSGGWLRRSSRRVEPREEPAPSTSAQTPRTEQPGGSGPGAAGDRMRPVDKVLRSGIFDRAYYEAQCGRSFASDEAAARDYLIGGRQLGFAPHPLFEPEWLRPDDWRRKPDPVISYVEEGGGSNGPSPWFDEEAYLRSHPEAEQHPGRALGHFLEHAQPEDALPLPERFGSTRLTWASARERAFEAAREYQKHADLRMAPRRTDFDEAGSASFVQTWLEHQVPERSDGQPLVSVVMPVRNRPVQVLEAIRSLQAQTLDGWELVVVDDGSTDETPDVLDREAAADARIAVVRREHAGVSAARNAGIAAARGDWLAFLDSDNTWVPHFLQVMVSYLHATGLRAGHAVVEAIGYQAEDGEQQLQRYLAFDGGLDHLLVRNHIDLNGLVVRRDVAGDCGGFDEALRRWVDHDFVIRVATRTEVPLVPFVGVRYDHDRDAADRISTTEVDNWQWVALSKHYVDWPALESTSDQRVGGRTSICMPTYEDWSMTLHAVDAVLDAAEADGGDGEADVEVVVAVNGSRRAVATLLRALFLDEARVRIRALPNNLNFALGSNVAFAESTGETVVFLNNDTEVRPGWLAPLLEELQDEQVLGCQPLLLYPDGSIQSAGTIFCGTDLPTAFLTEHPPEDARRLAPLRLHAVTAAALVMRAADVVRLRGFDPIFVNGMEDIDLCLRAVDGGPGRFSVVTSSVVIHHEGRTPGRGTHIAVNRRIWRDRWKGATPGSQLEIIAPLGLEVAHLTPGDRVVDPGEVRMVRPLLVRPARAVAEGPAAGLPSLRWALKTSVPLRAPDDTPDLVRADLLAAALRRLGQDVVVDRWETNQRASGYLDDVSVALRGRLPLVEDPGRVNLAWVYDLEEPLAAEEVARYDAFLTLADGRAVVTEAPGQVPAAEPDLAVVEGLVDDAARALLTEAARTRGRARWPVPGGERAG